MKGAAELAPKTCPDCKARLPKMVYEHLYLQNCSHSSDSRWRIHCTCGVVMVWSYPNIWKRTHRLNIFAGSDPVADMTQDEFWAMIRNRRLAQELTS